jgi:haloacid dehalogenase-like hydrolase
MSGQRDIRLLLADVDGTLVTQDKVLTEAAKAAVREMCGAGIALAITSGRPPRGMSMLIEPLALKGAVAGFNGGVFVNPDLSVIESHTLDPATAKQALALILGQGLDAWVYTEEEWLIRKQDAPRVARETWTVKFDAKIVASFTDAHLAHAVKIRRRLRRPQPGRRLREGDAEHPGREGERSALAAVLPRRDPPASQQGGRRGNPVQAYEHPARADRHDRGHAQRRPDVPQKRLLHRDGQFQR